MRRSCQAAVTIESVKLWIGGDTSHGDHVLIQGADSFDYKVEIAATHIEIATWIEGNIVRSVELRLEGRNVGRSEEATTGEGVADDLARRRDNFADPVVACVCDKNVSRAVYGHPERRIQLRGNGRTIVAAFSQG